MPDHDAEVRQPDELRARPSVWKSKSLRLAILVTIVGLAMWVYSLATAPAPSPTPATADGGGLVSGFSATPAARSAPAKPRLIDDSAPVMFRLGLSFLAGFFVGFVLKKFVRTTILIAGAAATAIIVAKKTGLIDLDWNTMEEQVKHGVDVAQHEAGRFKDVLLSYAPSGASAVAGVFMGGRRRG